MKKEPTKEEVRKFIKHINSYEEVTSYALINTWEAYKWLSLHPVKKWYQFWK